MVSAPPSHTSHTGSAPLLRQKNSARALAAPAYDQRRDSSDADRRPTTAGPRAAEVVPRRAPVSAGAVGSSPPLPPLPQKTPVQQYDPRAAGQAPASSGIEPLLPSYSSRPGSQSSMSGLGIGVELPALSSSAVEPPRTSQRAATPPQAEVKPLEVRSRSVTPPQQVRQSEALRPSSTAPSEVMRLDPLLTSRDRIALLRTGARSSVSSESGVPARLGAGAVAGASSARGANRGDPTRSYTLGDVPAGFDVALASPPRAPLKPLQLASRRSSVALDHSRRSSLAPGEQSRRSSLANEHSRRSSLNPEQTLAASSGPRGHLRRPSEVYCRRPMVNASTQTPREWRLPASPVQAVPRSSSSVSASASRRPSWMHAVSTPPQAYGAFPVLPPPVPPHDTPHQKHGISPSIYSVASFDPRASISAPMPHWNEVAELEASPPEVNYDVPYLSPLVDEDYASVVRRLDDLATPVPRSLVEEAVEQSRLAAALPVNAVERTPTLPLAPVASSDPASFRPPSFAAAGADALVLSTQRSRTPSPVPALSHGHSSADETDLSSSSSSLDRRASSVFSSSPHRSANAEIDTDTSRSEPLTPPTSAVSSLFPESCKAAVGDDEAEPEPEVEDEAAVVTIRKASLVTSEVRKASLVSTGSSAPGSVASGVARSASVASIPEHHLSAASTASSVAPVSAPTSSCVVFAVNSDEAPVVAQTAASDSSAPPSTASPSLEEPRPCPTAPPSLPPRRNSEPLSTLVAGPRLRTPGTTKFLSGADRASRGRSFFLVQALMGESQPEGMVRDWARGAESDSDSEEGSGSEEGEVGLLGDGDESDFDEK